MNTENVHVEVGHAADYGIEISNHHSVSKLFGVVLQRTVARRNGENAAEENIKPKLNPCGFCVKLPMYCRLHLKPEYARAVFISLLMAEILRRSPTQSTECFTCIHEDLSSIPRSYVKTLGRAACV